MVAPDYLHLSGIAVSITFWGGIGLAVTLILTAAIIACRAERESLPQVNIAEIGYNTALAGGAVALLASILRPSRISVMACIIALTGIGVDYWFGPPRVFFWDKPTLSQQMGLRGEPLGWSRLFINDTLFASSKQSNINEISIMGANVGDQEIKMEDAYFISGIDGTRLDAKIGWGGREYKIQEIKPIPPHAFLFIMSSPIGPANVGLSQEDFLKRWGIVTLVTKYNGSLHRTSFDYETVKSMMPKPTEPYPHISPITDH